VTGIRPHTPRRETKQIRFADAMLSLLGHRGVEIEFVIAA
jgi:hypothetical protein